MMIKYAGFWLLFQLFSQGTSFAAPEMTHLAQAEMKWLQKATIAAQKLSYSGTFVYRNGKQSETSRIVHVASNGNRREKLVVLDGSPREVIRNNDEVQCYLPELRQVIIEQRSTRRAFPALLPASLSSLGKHYVLRQVASARVAGFDSRVLRLEPRDSLRYGHQYWIDADSGLLLKAEVFDARGEILESLAFTELQLGEPHADALKPSYAVASPGKPGWEVRQARLSDLREEVPWQFKADLPGFRREASLRRSITQEKGEAQEVLHWVFSDGLAALSVFISPLPDNQGAGNTDELQTGGAFSVAKRVLDRHQIVVMGDVPPETVKLFAAGIVVKSK